MNRVSDLLAKLTPGPQPRAGRVPSGLPGNLTEKQVSDQVDDFMKAEGWRRIRHSSGTANRVQNGIAVGMMQIGEPGMPDRQYIYYLGRKPSPATLTVWVELKRSKGGHKRDSQANWHARETARGALIYSGEADGRRFSIDDFRRWYDKHLRPVIEKVAKGQPSLFSNGGGNGNRS